MLIKKKQLLTATLMVALTAAVAVNWYYTNNTPISGNENVSQESYAGDSLLVAGTVKSEDNEINADELSAVNASASDTYFSQAKLKRDQSHDEIIDEIEDFADDDSIGQDEKSKVIQMLDEFKSNIKKESDIENLINAKAPGQVLVVINDGTGSVVVEKGVLNDTLVMQITDIFEKNTGISAENLTIIEAK